MKTAARLAVIALLVCGAAWSQEIKVSKDNRTIAVSTSDKATAEADTAILAIGFKVYAADEQAAYALGSKTSNSIADALKKAGVAESAIESESQSISPVQPFELQNLPEAQKAQRQFSVQQSWSVKTSAKNAAAVLDAAVKAGANQSGNIEWTVADPDALEAQAAGKALKRARAVAARMAEGLGAKLGPLVYASNQIQQARPVPMAMASAAARVDAVAPLAINPHKVERSASVYAVFAIE